MRYSYCPSIMNHSKNKQLNSPSVLLNIENAVLLVSEPLSRIFPAEPLDDGDGRLGHVTREVQLVDAAEDDVVDLHGVAGSERGSEKYLD